ncbi:MAG: TonB family protein [Gemmatimonadota bacterium]|nr:TonB family protein [Gemmatimonadota bacterium]
MHAYARFLLVLVATPALAQGTLTGHVRGPGGLGIGGVEVRAVGGAEPRAAGGVVIAVTDDEGAFRLVGLPLGGVQLSARRIGFRPTAMELVVAGTETRIVALQLEPAAILLAPVTVNARREPYSARLAGFQQRSQKRIGTFITRERIEASASSSFSDLLRGIPGVRMAPSRNGISNSLRFRGSNCPPLVFIDGAPASADEFDVDIIDPATVEGVEIYMSMLTVPPELHAPRGLEHCGVIAVWSRPFRPRTRRAETPAPVALRQLLDAAAVFVAETVDQRVRLEPGTFQPIYPDSLWRAATSGDVLVEFVIDAFGRLEPEFFSVVSATHPAFGESVREALLRARFEPAMKRGRRVRQLVYLPTHFERRVP